MVIKAITLVSYSKVECPGSFRRRSKLSGAVFNKDIQYCTHTCIYTRKIFIQLINKNESL